MTFSPCYKSSNPCKPITYECRRYIISRKVEKNIKVNLARSIIDFQKREDDC